MSQTDNDIEKGRSTPDAPFSLTLISWHGVHEELPLQGNVFARRASLQIALGTSPQTPKSKMVSKGSPLVRRARSTPVRRGHAASSNGANEVETETS